MIHPGRPWSDPPMRFEGERVGNLSGKDGGPGAGTAATLKWTPLPSFRIDPRTEAWFD